MKTLVRDLVRRADLAMLSLLVVAALTPGCSDAAETGEGSANGPSAMGQAGITGVVVETMDASVYTYLHVDTGEEKLWVAGPQTPVKVGDEVSFSGSTPMRNFHSNSLNRDFEMIHFVSAFQVEGAAPPAPFDHGTIPESQPQMEVDFSGIQKAEDGSTVGEVFGAGAALSGQQVTIRGKVVKFTGGIMGKNWLHLQDGTAAPDGANDLVVTTDATVAVGDTIVIRGTVTTDRDFGFGYSYDLLIEDASVTPE